MENIIITFQEPWFKNLEDYKRILELEYNIDTSTHSLSPKDKGMILSDTLEK